MATEEKQQMTTALSEWTNAVTGLVTRDFETNGVSFDEYSKTCAMNCMSSIFQLVKSSGVGMNEIETSNLQQIVKDCASLKLNANSYPKECYFQLRKKKIGDKYVQTIEMGLEGAGHESMLRNFGVNVDTVYDFWRVKEGDVFVYPKRKGLEMTPPEWEEKGLSQKTIRVVLPVKLKDGTVTYLISERESVKVNLFAHVRNNLMNETFGVCENRFKATEAQKKQIDAKKEEIYSALRKCETLEEMIKCEIALPYISGAWLDTFESMVVRKMQNNAVRNFPKSLNTMAKTSFIEMDDSYKASQEEIEENENSIPFDDANVVDSTAREVTVDERI